METSSLMAASNAQSRYILSLPAVLSSKKCQKCIFKKKRKKENNTAEATALDWLICSQGASVATKQRKRFAFYWSLSSPKTTVDPGSLTAGSCLGLENIQTETNVAQTHTMCELLDPVSYKTIHLLNKFTIKTCWQITHILFFIICIFKINLASLNFFILIIMQNSLYQCLSTLCL